MSLPQQLSLGMSRLPCEIVCDLHGGRLLGGFCTWEGLIFNPAFSMRDRVWSNERQCLSNVGPKTSTRSSCQVIPDSKLAIWRTKNGATLQRPKGTCFYCKCPCLVEKVVFSLSCG